MLDRSEFSPHAYDNPSSLSSISSPARPSPRMSMYGHHRTSSNVSNASNASSSSQSNVNPSFRLEDESDYSLYSPSHHYYRQSNYTGLPNQEYPFQYGVRQTLGHDGNNPNQTSDRPNNLDVVTRLRSSLKRSNYSYNSPSKNTSKSNSGPGTPTNPTPPDSLTSEDSSYVSAKDSQISINRVRFSPVTFDREQQHRDILDGQDTVPTGRRASGRARKASISDMERDFLS